MATVQVEEDSAHARAIQGAIQARLIEINWAPEENDTTLSDYITMMLVKGRNSSDVQAELAGDLLGIGEDDPMVPEFTQWLYQTAEALRPQAQPDPSDAPGVHQQPAEPGQDAPMDDAAPAAAGIPSGPKAMRGDRAGRGRGGRMLGQMSRQMDRSQELPESLRRIKGAANGAGRISGRDAPRGPRNQNVANGVQRMMNGRGGAMNAMPPPGAMMNQLDPQNQMMLMQMMEMQANMMQQMMQNGGPMPNMGQPPSFGSQGKSMFDRMDKRGQNKLRRPPHAKPEHDAASGMDVDEPTTTTTTEKKNPFDVMCRFNDKCTNPECAFAHQSPAITKAGIPVDLQDTCKFGARCLNHKCVGRHPSPCLSEAWQQRQNNHFGGAGYQEPMLCRFYPNCTRGDECPYLHSDTAKTSIPCRYSPCTKADCPFIHAEGQQALFKDKTWTANGDQNGMQQSNGETNAKVDRFAEFKENESQPEELIRPGQDVADGVPT